MDWVPILFVTFKALVLVIGMFFAIKWHYDKGKTANEKRAVLRGAGIAASVFLLSLLGLGLFTFVLISKLGLDVTFP